MNRYLKLFLAVFLGVGLAGNFNFDDGVAGYGLLLGFLSALFSALLAVLPLWLLQNSRLRVKIISGLVATVAGWALVWFGAFAGFGGSDLAVPAFYGVNGLALFIILLCISRFLRDGRIVSISLSVLLIFLGAFSVRQIYRDLVSAHESDNYKQVVESALNKNNCGDIVNYYWREQCLIKLAAKTANPDHCTKIKSDYYATKVNCLEGVFTDFNAARICSYFKNGATTRFSFFYPWIDRVDSSDRTNCILAVVGVISKDGAAVAHSSNDREVCLTIPKDYKSKDSREYSRDRCLQIVDRRAPGHVFLEIPEGSNYCGDYFDQDLCWEVVAPAAKQPDLCAKIADNVRRNNCIDRIGRNNLDIDICQKISDSQLKQECVSFISLVKEAVSKKDITVCLFGRTQSFPDSRDCIRKAAAAVRDTSFCNIERELDYSDSSFLNQMRPVCIEEAGKVIIPSPLSF